MNIYDVVEQNMFEWMPRAAAELEEMLKVSLLERQDILFILFGPPGKGKSNLGYNLSIFFTRIANRTLGTNRSFNLDEQAAWLGADYLRLFKEPGEKFADLLQSNDEKKLEELIDKTKGKVYWLDEAKDLSAKDTMTKFNKTFSGILATCRALQHIYIMCIDSPTKLLTDIREFRVNGGMYCFIGNSSRVFQDGVRRHVRVGGLYGRREWSRMIFDSTNNIRRNLLTPQSFINRYPPYSVETIPLFPRGKRQKEYKLLKHGNMGKIIKEDIQEWEPDSEGGTVPCWTKCKNCGYVWEYGGKYTTEPERVIQCPKCRYKYKIRDMHELALGWID